MNSPSPWTTTTGNERGVATLQGEAGLIVGLRLVSVREGAIRFHPMGEPGFFAVMHQAGITISIRWIVFPTATVSEPGHVELFLLAYIPGNPDPGPLVEELRALLALAFPQHGFDPLRSGDALLFALAPFGDWAWSLALGPSAAPARRRLLGFGSPGDEGWASGPPIFYFDPKRADPTQALFLLAGCPWASTLEWTLSPREASGKELSEDSSEDLPPLAFECRLLWCGSAGTAPTILGASVAKAFGVLGAISTPVVRLPAPFCHSPTLEEPELPSAFLAAHASLPGLLPSPSALSVLNPALLSPVQPHLPNIHLPEEGAPLGRAADGRIVRLSLLDRLRHLWVLGQTGTGKSTLLLNRILQDIEEGIGVAVFDPHGELVAEVLRRIPASRRQDVLSVDVTDRQNPLPVLNLLECSNMESAHSRAGQVIELITNLWPKEFCGPVFQQACMHALLMLAARFEDPGTIADLPRLFMEKAYLESWLEDPQVKGRVPNSVTWWTEVYSNYTSSNRSEAIEYFTSKFSLFFNDPVLGAILGKSRSTLNLRQIMDQRGILLCNLARGGSNPMATSMLTSVFMQASLNAALSRANIPANQRVPFFVYCDEFHRIAGSSTGAILSEVRKYGLGLVLAHQFVDQLPEETLAAVLGNVGTKLVFRVGARDAERLVGYHPELTKSELIRLPNFMAIAELLLDGVPSPPITLWMQPPPP